MYKQSLLICTGAFLLWSAVARADGGPVALEKWSRYHVHIVPYQEIMVPKPGKRAKWVPKVSLVFRVDDPESDDVILLQHYRGKRKWGPVQKCQIGDRQKTERRGKGGKRLGYYLVHPVCMMDNKLATPRTGKFSVTVSYKVTGEGKTYKDLGTYTYTVKPYNHNWTPKGPLKSFYVDQDHRMGEAWLYLPTNGKVEIWSWFKYDRDGAKHVRGGRMRCFVDGKKMKFYDNPTSRTEVKVQHYTGNLKHKTTYWGLWYWWAPRVGDELAGDWLSKHPGKVRCALTQNGEIAREFFFEVDKDGNVVRPECQKSGAVRSLDEEFVIKMTFKKNPDLKFDKRAFKRTPFYHPKAPKGCPW
jgi:hypothetical protein